jgi:FkbM family methyltransferase
LQIDFVCHHSPELGQRIVVALDRNDRDDPYVEQFRTSYPFPPVLRFLLQDRRGISRFVDVGANLGQVCLAASALGLNCLAIEPHPQNYVLLSQAFIANGFMKTRVVWAAASDQKGSLNLVGASAWAHVMRSRAPDKSDGLLVPASPLDELLRLWGPAPDLIKIDVEGHEPAVLRGLGRTLRSSRPPLLIIESNTWTLGGLARTRCMLEAIEEQDYELHLFLPDGSVTHRPAAILQPTVCVDYLAVPRASTARALPTIRPLPLQEELTMMEAEPLDSGPHALHVSHAIVELETRGGAFSGRLERLKRRIAEGNPRTVQFIVENWDSLRGVPAWLL